MRVARVFLLASAPQLVFGISLDANLFNYDATSFAENGEYYSYGPSDWSQVACFDLETCPGWPEKWVTGLEWSLESNHCVDCESGCGVHHQSPINLDRSWGLEDTPDEAEECEDNHWIEYIDGTCSWDHLVAADAFTIERHALRIGQPLKKIGESTYRLNCQDGSQNRFPFLDYSNGFNKPFLLSHTEIKVPSEHTQDGKRFDAEIQLPHFFNSSEDTNDSIHQMGTIAIFLQADESYAPYPFLDKLICQFRHVEDKSRENCGMSSVEHQYPGCYNHNRTISISISPASIQKGGNRNLRLRAAALDRILEGPKNAPRFSIQAGPIEENKAREEWTEFIQDYSRQHSLRVDQTSEHLIDYEDVEHSNYRWMLDVRTEYYFRYSGTMTIPPCYGKYYGSESQTNNWRVMKDPIRVHPRQIRELHRLLRNRIAPFDDANTNARCKEDTAAKKGDGGTVSVARPLQELSLAHYNTFCQCRNWPSQWPEDQKWCKSGNETFRFFENPYNEPSDATCTLGNFLASPNSRVQGAHAILMPSSIDNGTTIQSPTVEAFLLQRNDGNLVVLNGTPSNPGNIIWESGMALSEDAYYSEINNQGRLSTRRKNDDSIVFTTNIGGESISHWFALDCDGERVGIYEGRWDIPGNRIWKSTPLSEFAWSSNSADVFQVPFHASALGYSDFVEENMVHNGICSEGPVDADPTNETICNSRGSMCAVGWTDPGEQLIYSFNNTVAPQLVDIVLRASSDVVGSEFRVEIDGIGGKSFRTIGGGWDSFNDHVWSTTLKRKGNHKLVVTFVDGNVNLCAISVLVRSNRV